MNPASTPAPTAPSAPAPTAAAPAAPATPAVPQYNTGAAMDAIRQYYQIPGATAGIVGQQQANAYNAQTGFENSQALKSLQLQHMKDKLDPNKYLIRQGDDGSTNIIDPTGQKVDVGTYANLTGVSPAEVLKNSTNPDEKQFVSDYNSFQTYLQSLIDAKNGNNEAQNYVDDMQKKNPDLVKLPAEQIRQLFMQQYGNYFGKPVPSTSMSTNWTPALDPQTSKYLYERNLLSGTGTGATGADLFNSAAGQ